MKNFDKVMAQQQVTWRQKHVADKRHGEQNGKARPWILPVELWEQGLWPGSGYVQPWTPKDHEMRILPLPPQAINLLSRWQSTAPENCPYVFMDAGRWDYYRQEVDGGRWTAGRDLMNNILRPF